MVVPSTKDRMEAIVSEKGKFGTSKAVDQEKMKERTGEGEERSVRRARLSQKTYTVTPGN
jgi:hypothetical protein